MSLLSEIVSTVETINIKSVDETISQLGHQVQDAKKDVTRFIEDTFVNYAKKMRKNKYLLKEVEEINKKLEETSYVISKHREQQISTCKANLKNEGEKLSEIKYEMQYISELLNITNTIVETNNLKQELKYNEAILKLLKVSEFIKSVPQDECLYVMEVLQSNIKENMHLIMYQVGNKFKDNITYTSNNIDNKTVTNVKIKRKNSEMNEVCMALFSNNNHNILLLNKFTDFLFENVFTPVIQKNCNVNLNDDIEAYTLTLVVVNNDRNSYEQVFSNILKVAEYLKLGLTYSLSKELSIINYISNRITEKLAHLLIKECLEYTIPSTPQGLSQYESVKQRIENFEKRLIEYEIFKKDMMPLLEYANNIDILFINKKCKDYVETAVKIMKKDLHEYVEVGEPYKANSFLEATEFPRCTVSKSSIELLTLLTSMLDAAVASSEICSARITCTVVNILSSYISIVPEHHKKLLQTIPQQVALFYNNCLYLAYNLTKLQKKYSKLNENYSEYLFKIKSAGQDMFQSTVEQHKEQNDKIMKDAGILGLETLEKVEPQMEKCVRQCLRQQELLKTVWQKVLSYEDYNKSVGYILNGLCKFIIQATLRFVDISSEAAEQLGDVMKVIQGRGPKLFTEPKEINLYVESWYKFNELEFVLNTNLAGINDRWADGKGPLALQFEVLELRNLICALFQNTHVRSAVLDKIK